ncbi:hypothetical protein DITRI_Ditri14bG0094900 [Diplodiscus trichospermus]
MLGVLSSASLTLVLGGSPASFTAHCGNGSAAKALAFPGSSGINRRQLLIKSSVTSTSRTTPAFRIAVAAMDSDQLSPDNKQAKKYYFVVANAKFMLDEEEHFKELLFERLRNYGERNKEQDFWLVIEPKFLEKFPDITKRLRRPAVALVSTNGSWITFMKLRLDRVLSDSYEADSPEEALASNPTTLEFEKPENWVAPYPKYEFGWWEPFLPTGLKEAKV